MLRILLILLLMPTTFVAAASPHMSQHIATARMVAAARAQIDDRLGGESALSKVTVVGTPEDVVVPSGTVTLKLHPPAGRWPRSRVGVPVDVVLDGQVVRSVTVWFALEVQREVLGYAVDAAAGTSASALKMAPQRVDAAAAQGSLVRDPHEIEAMRLRRPVIAGSMARMEDFESVPDVDRQQRVRVAVEAGAIQMQTHGTAIGKGNAGDVVPVLVDTAESPVRARVIDKGAVEVVQ
jgi:flagellar basal body P-ring formation protein FlgA